VILNEGHEKRRADGPVETRLAVRVRQV